MSIMGRSPGDGLPPSTDVDRHPPMQTDAPTSIFSPTPVRRGVLTWFGTKRPWVRIPPKVRLAHARSRRRAPAQGRPHPATRRRRYWTTTADRHRHPCRRSPAPAAMSMLVRSTSPPPTTDEVDLQARSSGAPLPATPRAARRGCHRPPRGLRGRIRPTLLDVRMTASSRRTHGDRCARQLRCPS